MDVESALVLILVVMMIIVSAVYIKGLIIYRRKAKRYKEFRKELVKPRTCPYCGSDDIRLTHLSLYDTSCFSACMSCRASGTGEDPDSAFSSMRPEPPFRQDDCNP